jgi:CDP-glucose 4,6-dehydratase
MGDTFWKNRKVFITGHTGFKGSWLSLWLLLLNAKLTGYALAPQVSPNLFDLIGIKQQMNSLEADIRHGQNLIEAMLDFQPEIVFHLAAQPLVRQSYHDPKETFETNIMGTVNLLEAVKLTKSVRVVINVTTDKVYENKEWLWGYRENEPMGGYDPYSSSKACSELVTAAYRNSYFGNSYNKTHRPVSIATVRAGNVIGGGDWAKDRLIPDCIRKWSQKQIVKIRNPSAIRPWQHVLDPLSGYKMLAEIMYNSTGNYATAWNFGPNEIENNQSVQNVVDILGKSWGPEAQWEVDSGEKPHESSFLRLDCAKARIKLGWQPKWNLQKTIINVSEWYKLHYDKPDLIREFTEKQIYSHENS